MILNKEEMNMLLGEVMDGLRDVRDGKAVMTPEQADNVLDAI